MQFYWGEFFCDINCFPTWYKNTSHVLSNSAVSDNELRMVLTIFLMIVAVVISFVLFIFIYRYNIYKLSIISDVKKAANFYTLSIKFQLHANVTLMKVGLFQITPFKMKNLQLWIRTAAIISFCLFFVLVIGIAMVIVAIVYNLQYETALLGAVLNLSIPM